MVGSSNLSGRAKFILKYPARMKNEIILDVSTLEPCEPLEKALAAIEVLQKGQFLRMLHRMEPHPLYAILKERQFDWSTQPGKKTPIEIFIWHKNDPIAAEQVQNSLS